jgi:hypothetical protein
MKAQRKEFKVKVSEKKLLARLKGHPELLARVERRLDREPRRKCVPCG